MADVQKITNDTVARGGVLALLYFDLHGTSKEMLQQLGSGFVQKVLGEPGVVYAMGEILDPVQENDLFSTSMELKILTKDLTSLAVLCSTYSPFSMDILRPSEFSLSVDKVHELLMHISSVSFDFKKYVVENVAKPEDVERYRRSLQNKIELGKRLEGKEKKIERGNP